jgi:hypothetical protein
MRELTRKEWWSLAYGVAWTTFSIVGSLFDRDEPSDADEKVISVYTPAMAADHFLAELEKRFPETPSAKRSGKLGMRVRGV